MITCFSCQHQNPDGATQCEACYTPLPVSGPTGAESSCPNCAAPVQPNATFCGQCGYSLLPSVPEPVTEQEPVTMGGNTIPPTVTSGMSGNMEIEVETPVVSYSPPPVTSPPPIPAPDPVIQSPPPTYPEPVTLAEVSKPPVAVGGATKLQVQTASLFHVQTGTKLELQQNLSVVHIGKPNDQIPPDIDVSGFPNSEIVSRIHADIRIEADSFFIEDVGSSNGTYINHTPLLEGNRHRLRPGDRIALGKGDKMTFIFQMS